MTITLTPLDPELPTRHGYRQGRRTVVGGVLTTKKRRPRVWKAHEAVECQRVFREPVVPVLRVVERR